MHVYIINLDSTKDRWASVSEAFAETELTVCRVSGVNGYALDLPIPEYAEGMYRWFHDRPTSPGHVGCYLSHVKAMKVFLANNADHTLIAEDDLTLEPDFEAVLRTAIEHSQDWNVLRLRDLGHWQMSRRLEHQNSSGCRECSLRPGFCPFPRSGARHSRGTQPVKGLETSAAGAAIC